MSEIPLHSVVSVICNCLTELSPHDQTRALEAAKIVLGGIPLHSIISVICDSLVADLSPDDQQRALEATRVALKLDGARGSAIPTTRKTGPSGALPMVEIQMTPGGPMVVAGGDPNTPPRVVMADASYPGAPGRPQQLRQPTQPAAGRGYRRPVR